MKKEVKLLFILLSMLCCSCKENYNTSYVIYDKQLFDNAKIYIQKEEGLSLKAYKDNNKFSICYGATWYYNDKNKVIRVKKNDIFTKKQCDKILDEHIDYYNFVLQKKIGLKAYHNLTIEQKVKLIDLLYHKGEYNVGTNSFLKTIKVKFSLKEDIRKNVFIAQDMKDNIIKNVPKRYYYVV